MANNQRHPPENQTFRFKSKKTAREYQTIKLMIELYCRKIHKSDSCICGNCLEILNYSGGKLEFCNYLENKPRCQDCMTPCYAEPQKSLIRQVMKFSGPRMILYHPLLAIQHLLLKYLKRPNL